jgi:hypothetical protein
VFSESTLLNTFKDTPGNELVNEPITHENWKEVAIRLVFEEGKSYEEAGLAVGRSHWTIKKLVQERKGLIPGLQRVKTAKGGRKPMSAYPIVSEEHRALGVRLNNHRTLKLGWNLDEMADYLGSNRSKVQFMEAGRHDFTLSEIRRISELIGSPMLDLITPLSPIKVASRQSTV